MGSTSTSTSSYSHGSVGSPQVDSPDSNHDWSSSDDVFIVQPSSPVILREADIQIQSHNFQSEDDNEKQGLPTKPPREANKKERRRTLSINSAFSDLRNCIPNVPTDTKLSKIKTLRLAISYIRYLMQCLDDDRYKMVPSSASSNSSSGLSDRIPEAHENFEEFFNPRRGLKRAASMDNVRKFFLIYQRVF